ncbi:MobF family relaxase, partial [Ilumatobacter sp.]|uniref:MobF family relaxase n=1 Tax=Ilumatobacter sp. TaxID=1967498 RepID=UPI0037503E16
LAGLAPGTGLTPNNTQVRTFKNRVPGFDLTFSAPKSVSILYALGDPLVRAQVVEATDLAVAEALGWLEREACFVRRGSNTHPDKTSEFDKWGTRRLRGVGFIAAQFRHRTSRQGDPQLHSHVLIANMTKGPDGKWSALDGQAIFKSKIAAGTVYQSVLRNELSQRLGVEWTEVHKGLADIIGIPDTVCRQFSKRRAEIETELARTGKSGPAAAGVAALDTRTAKHDIDQETLDALWLAEAKSIGYGPDDINHLLDSANPASRDFATRTADGVLAKDSIISIQTHSKYHGTIAHEQLTIDQFATRIGHKLPETDAIVNRLGVQNAVADQLGGTGSARLLERLTDAVLAHRELVPLPQESEHHVAWEQRWTTRTLINKEAELTALFTPDPTLTAGVVDPGFVEHYIANINTTLGPDQADTVRRLTTQGLAVEAVVGKAGTGKTYTMNAVREVFEAAGYNVVGACPTGRAARELCEGAGIDSVTIQRLNVNDLNDRSVVVLDEAGMIGTFNFHHVITNARRAGAKVIVVGDHHQLPEIEAGGSFAALLRAVQDQRCELTINRRQRHEWEHPALDHLRNGDIQAFWQAYLDHGRVVLADDQAEV